MSDYYDTAWVARQLCDWAADLFKKNTPFPPSLAEWLADGLISASNEESLDKALKLKRRKGRKQKLDENVQIKFQAAHLVVNEGMSIGDVFAAIANQRHKSVEAIRSIVNSKKGWDFTILKKVIKQGE